MIEICSCNEEAKEDVNKNKDIAGAQFMAFRFGKAFLNVSILFVLWVCVVNGERKKGDRLDCLSMSERESLMDFYNSTNGDSWRINRHWGSEENICNWFGVRCESVIVNNVTVDMIVSLYDLRIV